MENKSQLHDVFVNSISSVVNALESSCINETMYTHSENIILDDVEYNLFLNFGVSDQVFIAEISLTDISDDNDIFDIFRNISKDEFACTDGGLAKLVSDDIKDFCGKSLPSYLITGLNSSYNLCFKKNLSLY